MSLPLVRSALIPQPFGHGFTTRGGGVSPPPFESLNFGLKWGDARDNVLENRRRLLAETGGETLYKARQVHGTTLLRIRRGDDPERVAETDADGLYSDEPGPVLTVTVADCVPVLLADPRTGAFAAVHAGWRGTVAAIVQLAVRALAGLGARPGDLRVALGPSIGPCCFEVGPEVIDAVLTVHPRARATGVILDRAPRPHVHLRRLNALLLEEAGVPGAAIDDCGLCTCCTPDRFFSFRRDAQRTGQHLGFVGRRVSSSC